jgi:hypothetical protein
MRDPVKCLAEADPEVRMAWRDRSVCHFGPWEIDHYSQTGQTGIAASYELMSIWNANSECKLGKRKGQASRLNRSSPLRDTNKVEGQK